jgi:glutamyl-tRNA synthetase
MNCGCKDYDKCKTLTIDEIKEKINNKVPYVIRLKSNGDETKRFEIKDLVKGKLSFEYNILDIVLIKADGLPTYHFAHAIDDHLMGTTTVIRGDEWLSSLPIHEELFRALNFRIPKYAHISPLLKKDGDTIRKISKRKDPEAGIAYYYEAGIPINAVKIYLLTIANTNFEGWYNQNKDKSIYEFEFTFNKMSKSGSIFDLDKLLNISKNYLSRLNKEQIYNEILNYNKVFDIPFYNLMIKYSAYTKEILNIEREQKKPRKDYEVYKDFRKNVWFMYDELFEEFKKYGKIVKVDERNILADYINIYNQEDTKDQWYSKIKELAIKYNYASEVKDYKENPENYKGHVGDICEIIRYAVSSCTETPDLYTVLNLLGKEKINSRINNYLS